MDYRIAKDKIAGQVMFIMTIASILLVIAMTIGLFIKSEPILSQYHLWDLLTESNWRPMEGKFGFLPFLAGTFWCHDYCLTDITFHGYISYGICPSKD